MKVVIIGAGEVGYHVIGTLYREGVDIVAVDSDPAVLARLREEFNISTQEGNASDPAVLASAGVEQADLFMAVTNSDETNLISCMLAQQAGAARRIARVKSIDLGVQSDPIGSKQMGIDLVINPYEVAAGYLEQLVLHPQVMDYHRFMHDEVLLVGVPIRAGEPLAGMRVAQFGRSARLPQTLIALIQRGGQSFIAHGDHHIQAGDCVYFFCASAQLKDLFQFLGLPQQPIRRVFINGGGHIGYTLARRLERLGLDVRILEINKERCDLLSQWLDHTLVLHSDGMDSTALKAENIERSDFYVSVTAEDSVNVVSCLLAKELGAARVVPLVKQPEMLPILQNELPMHTAFSPRLLTARHILRFTRGANLSSFFSFPNTDIEILELQVREGLPCEKRPIANLKLPEGMLVGAVRRGERIFVPRGGDHLVGGDTVLLIQRRRNRRIANEMFLAAGMPEGPASATGAADASGVEA